MTPIESDAALPLGRGSNDPAAPLLAPEVSARVVPVALLMAFGGALAVLFHTGWTLGIRSGVVAFLLLSLWGGLRIRVTTTSLLPRFLILLYCLPFSVLVGYLFDSHYVWVFSRRGMEVSSDPLVVRDMIAIGLIGLCGFLAGLKASAIGPDPVSKDARPVERRTSLALIPFLLLLVVALGLSWMSAPQESILTARYAVDQSATIAEETHFAAAYMVSYVLLTALMIDLEREALPEMRRVKSFWFWATVAYIVVVLQLLRGDRESSGLVAALAALYITSPRGASSLRELASLARARIRRLLLPGVFLIAVFIALGAARSMLSQARAAAKVFDPVEIFELGLSQNTWTAVLWTNLGAAWEYRTGVLRYRWGSTYLGYVLSLPPGMVTHAIGYERPVDTDNLANDDPAHVSAGGLHAVVTPFKNFGAPGALLILFLYGWIVGRIERAAIRQHLGARMAWAAFFCGGFMWFWYGDTAFMRTIMILGLVYLLYRVALSVRLRRVEVAR